MSQHYSDPTRESDPHALPNIEVFHAPNAERCDDCGSLYPDGGDKDCDCEVSTYAAGGWYWQACFPGCLPDGEPMGPFDTEAEVIADAQDID